MRNGFVIEGLTPNTLAKKLVEVGEGHQVMYALGALLQDIRVIEYMRWNPEQSELERVRIPSSEIEAFNLYIGDKYGMMFPMELEERTPTQTLTIAIDASAVQEAIDKEMANLGVLGEIAKLSDEPIAEQFKSRQEMVDNLGRFYRLVSIAQFSTELGYREALLNLAALTVQAIKEHDDEQRG